MCGDRGTDWWSSTPKIIRRVRSKAKKRSRVLAVSIRPKHLLFMIFKNSNNNTWIQRLFQKQWVLVRQARFWGQTTYRCHPTRQQSRQEQLPEIKAHFNALLGELQHLVYAVRTCLVYKQVSGEAWECLSTCAWRYMWLGTAVAPWSCPSWLFLL